MKTPLRSLQKYPTRESLPHAIPDWVKPGALFFITICCTPRRKNQLCRPEIAAGIFESVAHRQAQLSWFVRLLVLMPDHLHALIAFPPEADMNRAITIWKSFLARRHRIRWQRDFFDHRMRNDESEEEKAHYIRMNPVRAKLTAAAEQWPYIWEPT